MTVNKKIALNTIFLTSSLISAKVIAYIYFLLLIKALTPEEIGIWGVLITSLLFMELISGLGTEKVLIKELTSKKNFFWWYSLGIRILLSIFSFFSFIFIFKVFYQKIFNLYHREIIIFFLSIFIINLNKNIEIFFNANEKMIYMAIAVIIERIVIFIGSILMYEKIIRLNGFLINFFIAQVLSSIFYLYFFKNEKVGNFLFTFQKLKYFLKESLIMFVIEVIAMIYFRIDIFMLSKLKDFRTTGFYHVAYKIFDFFITFFSGFLIAIFPHFSKKKKDVKILTHLIVGNIIFILVIIGAIIFRDDILKFFNKSYLIASNTLLILFLTLPLVYTNSVMNNYFIANNLQKYVLKFGIILIFLNIGLNFIFIPLWSMMGAAISTIICESFLTIFFIYFYVKLHLK